MKRLNFEEFKDRTGAVMRAQRIFTPHFTKNITTAFKIYQEVLADRDREIFINRMRDFELPSPLDEYERPKCPECGGNLFLRLIGVPKGSRNRKGWKSCWECINGECVYEAYSKKDLFQWMKRLRRK